MLRILNDDLLDNIHVVLLGQGIDLVRKTYTKNIECMWVLVWRNFQDLGMCLSSPHMRTSESSEESLANKSSSDAGLPKGSVLDWDQETPFLTSLSSSKTPFLPAVPVAGAAGACSSQPSLTPFRMYLPS